MENVIGRFFTSVVMYGNFIHFRPVVALKIALEGFTFTQLTFENGLKDLLPIYLGV